MSKRKGPKADRIDGYSPQPATAQDPWADPKIVQQMDARARQAARLDEMEHFDSFKNTLTGIGDFLRDKTLGGRQGGPEFEVVLPSGVVCKNLWRGSDLGKRIVETIPDEMTREGWELSIQPEEDDGEDKGKKKKADAFPAQQPAAPPGANPFAAGGLPPDPGPSGPGVIEEGDDATAAAVEATTGKLEEIGAADVFWEALCYEVAYGGAGVLMGIDDGQKDLSQPLDEDATFDDVTHLTAFTGGWDGELVAWSYYNDPTKPNYGMPEIYMLRNIGVPIARIPAPGSKLSGQDVLPKRQTEVIITWVHESRLLIFPGVAVSRDSRVQMRGWGDSVFTRVSRVLSQYDQTWGGIANLMTDFSQAVVKMKGLTQAAGAKGKEGTGGLATVTKKALAMNMSRSLARVLMLDSEDEFKRDTVSLGGIADMLQQFALRLAASADMPVDLLMGQGAGGALNKGDTTYRFFMDRVAARQKKRMLPQLRRLIGWVLRAQDGPTDGVEPEKWSVKMCALYQESDVERATRQKTVAETDQIYINMQVVTPEEVAATRFGGSEHNDGPIVIDFEGRREMAAQDEKDKAARAKAMAEAAKKPPESPAGGEGAAQPGTTPKPGEDKPAGGGGSHKVTVEISKGDAEE
jgi:phage-related protein (TIGR01555 family)